MGIPKIKGFIMKILSITDIHGEIEFSDTMETFMMKSDLILLPGDITHFGGKTEAKKIIENVKIYQSNILAVAGNCDKKPVDKYLEDENINIHGRVIYKNGIHIAGIGFSEETSWNKYPSQFSKKFFQRIAKKISEAIPQNADLILVSHTPPYNTNCDIIYDIDKKEIHAGNVIVREFIEKIQPLVCFCGHIHDAVGIDYIGKTLIINSGAAGKGNFAFLDLSLNPLKPLIIKGRS